MSTSSPGTAFPVLAKGDLALIRVVGPGVCREIGRFENLLLELARRGFATVVIDLVECPRIDSTFAGAFLRLADRAGSGPKFFLAGAQGAVADLLETLLVADQLPTLALPEIDRAEFHDVEVADRDRTREEIMSLSLDGHERLAGLNEANARRFATLLEVLRAQIPAKPAGADEPGTSSVSKPVSPPPASP